MNANITIKDSGFVPFTLNIEIETITDLKYLWLVFNFNTNELEKIYPKGASSEMSYKMTLEVIRNFNTESKEKIWRILNEQLTAVTIN